MTAIHAEFDVTLTSTYRVHTIPSGCRKPRWITVHTEDTVTIRHASTREAPVAMKLSTDCLSMTTKAEVRLYDGALYVQMTTRQGASYQPKTPGDSSFPAQQESQFASDNLDNRDTDVQEWAARWLIIDNEVWERTAEPCYVVMTFGLGHNHGGTGLGTHFGPHSGVPARSHFRADEYQAAAAYARDVAERRGDTESLSRFKPLIEVFIPDAVRLVVPPRETSEIRDAREQYQDAVRSLHQALLDVENVAEEGAFAEVVACREKLTALGSTDPAGELQERTPAEDR